MSALVMGSISTVADTSELQREAFNDAFREHGLDWNWERDDYRALLERSGGRDRIAGYAQSRGEDVDVTAVHDTKSRLFQEKLATAAPAPRPGVVETLHDARSRGMKVALVTTTTAENVTALFEGLAPHIGRSDFDLVVDLSQVERAKPDKAAYVFALDALGERSQDCVAVEDNLGGVAAAVAAGLTCVAFPNGNTAGHSFDQAQLRVDRLDLGELTSLVAGV